MAMTVWKYFAPFFRFDNQRLLIGTAGEMGWKVISLDARTAFLYPRG